MKIIYSEVGSLQGVNLSIRKVVKVSKKKERKSKNTRKWIQSSRVNLSKVGRFHKQSTLTLTLT